MSYIAFLEQLRHDFAGVKLFFRGWAPHPLPTPGAGFPFRHPLAGITNFSTETWRLNKVLNCSKNLNFPVCVVSAPSQNCRDSKLELGTQTAERLNKQNKTAAINPVNEHDKWTREKVGGHQLI